MRTGAVRGVARSSTARTEKTWQRSARRDGAWRARRRWSPAAARGSGTPSWKSWRRSARVRTRAPAARRSWRSAAGGGPRRACRSPSPPATSACAATGRPSSIGTVKDTFAGKLDILVNNAGQLNFKPAVECTAEDYSRLMATNLQDYFSVDVVTCRTICHFGSGTKEVSHK